MKPPNKYIGPALLHGVRIFVAIAGAAIGATVVLDRYLRQFNRR